MNVSTNYWNFIRFCSFSFKGTSCKKKIEKMKSKFHFNPMAEFMHENFEDSQVEEMFEEFKKTHGKSYNDPAEHEQRKHIFRHNMRSVRHLPC